VTAPTLTTRAVRAYLDLRAKARGDRRPVDELLQLYVIESLHARLDDCVAFDLDGAPAAAIRDEDAYSRVRVTMQAELAAARPCFHVDGIVGDPSTPHPRSWTSRACSAASSTSGATRS